MHWNHIDAARRRETVRAARADRAARENAPEKVLGEAGLVLAGAVTLALATQLACNLLGFG